MTQGSAREVRLAFVCFGGVSLAVYMYGVTREIQELLIASTIAERGQPETGITGTTRKAYMEALSGQSEKAGVPVRVVVDTIAGTSAGGIDGVFLAKAVAGDLSQSSLRELWFDQGDIKKLLKGFGPIWLRLAFFGIRVLLAPGKSAAPLRGDRMIRMLHKGLQRMDEDGPRSGHPGTLIPAGQSLDLFVTVTDGRGYRRFATVVPGGRTIRDRTHKHVLHFRASYQDASAEGAINQFTSEYNPALTFAARATSSFPGAFPAVTLNEFTKAISRNGEVAFDVDKFADDFFAEYTEWEDDPRQTWFIDGGVLDNAPFGYAIEAVDRKPAGTEVERHLVYVEPQPSPAPPAGEVPTDEMEKIALRDAGKRPAWLDTIYAAKSGIPAHQPILDELLALRDRNERIRRLRTLAVDRMPAIREALSKDERWNVSGINYSVIREITDDLHKRADAQLGDNLPAYQALRLQATARHLSSVVAAAFTYPESSSAAAFVREAMTAWIEKRSESTAGPSDQAATLLRAYDLPFRERRLRFVVQGINVLYGADISSPNRGQLDGAKAMLYESLEILWNVPARMGDSLRAEASGLFGPKSLRPWLGREPQEYLVTHAQEFDRFLDRIRFWIQTELDGFGNRLWDSFDSRTRLWPSDVRGDLLARYVGFPLWDGISFPFVALSEVSQATQINVNRINPDDATALRWKGPKLLSTSFHNFGGFLNRASRENDYLWGRLDGAELLLRLIDPSIDEHQLASAFRAVLAEEHLLQILRSGGPDSLGSRLGRAIDMLARGDSND